MKANNNNLINTERRDYDIAIIGAGPAGLSAALYAARANKSVILFEKDIPGGQLNHATHIENYPGFNPDPEHNSGADLVQTMVDQLTPYEGQVNCLMFTPVKHVNNTDKPDYPFEILTDQEHFYARGVIVATGLTHRHLFSDPSIEDALTDSGDISHCVLCDGQFNKGKSTIIIGDGNSALQAAIELAEINKDYENVSIYLISNVADFPPYADKRLVSKIDEINSVFNEHYKCRILPIFNFSTTDLTAFENNSGTRCRKVTGHYNSSPDVSSSFSVSGQIFVMVGQEPTPIATEIFPLLQSLNGYVGTLGPSGFCCPYVYAVGDCRSTAHSLRQAIVAASEGAVAATQLCSALDSN